MPDFKWPFRLSFFPPLHDHDVVTIHLNALDTSPVGLSCLLIWPCFFGPFLDLSPVRRDALVPFPRLHGETGPASHRLALLLCTVRRDASVPGFHGTLFQSKCSLPCHRVFVNFDLRAAVGLGVFTRVLYQSLGTWGTPGADLLVVLHTDQNLSRSFRSRTFRLFLFCPVDVWHNTGHLCLSSWKQASRTSSPRLDFGPYRNTKNHDPLRWGVWTLNSCFFLTCCQKPIKHVPWHFLCWFSLS